MAAIALVIGVAIGAFGMYRILVLPTRDSAERDRQRAVSEQQRAAGVEAALRDSRDAISQLTRALDSARTTNIELERRIAGSQGIADEVEKRNKEAAAGIERSEKTGGDIKEGIAGDSILTRSIADEVRASLEIVRALQAGVAETGQPAEE